MLCWVFGNFDLDFLKFENNNGFLPTVYTRV